MSNFNNIMRMTKPGANTDAFEEVIEFGADMAELQLKTTLKMHIVDDHLATFVKSMPSGFSLAAYSEQAMESTHYYHELSTLRFNVLLSFRKHAPDSVRCSVTTWNSSASRMMSVRVSMSPEMRTSEFPACISAQNCIDHRINVRNGSICFYWAREGVLGAAVGK